ncbi:MAG: hypothetical protein HZA52_09140 [Planctomycetes bacterium]|nr:hypothetical protein [Planctomycetota bacterium]
METRNPPASDARARWRTTSVLLAAHAGPVLLGAGVAFAVRAAPELAADFQPGPVTTWLADRDADAVIGLDDGLFEVKRIAIESPVEVERRSDGGLWAISARDRHPLGVHDLLLFAADGSRVAAAVLGPVLDLELSRDDALVVERKDASGRVVRVDAQGTISTVLELATASCAAGAGSRVAIGTDDGDVWLLDLGTVPPAVLAKRALGGPIGDVRPGPTPGTWWALDSGASGRVSLLEPTLATRWSVATGLHALHLAPVRGVERVWIADTTQPLARRYGANGALELDVSTLPLGGLDRAAASIDGGVLLIAPGAVLRLNPDGGLLPGQGGFDFLVDLTR